uniref:CTNNB1 binding N-teminal domain-containing protein n=1 Tax=Anabas testudineus TaxID=64144 RepID=A0AAQ6IKB5_ANATE
MFVCACLGVCLPQSVCVCVLTQQSKPVKPTGDISPQCSAHTHTHQHTHTRVCSAGVHRHQSQDLSGYYSLSSGGVGQITPSMSWFPHSLMLGPSGMHPTGIPHPAIVPPTGNRSMTSGAKREKEPKKPVIKKPLNVIAECTLKESAAINQILDWHALTRRNRPSTTSWPERRDNLHMQLYPTWSARDNYGKKKRRKREKQQDSNTDPGSPKKCRARFGLNQQTDWCGPCRCVPNIHPHPIHPKNSPPLLPSNHLFIT